MAINDSANESTYEADAKVRRLKWLHRASAVTLTVVALLFGAYLLWLAPGEAGESPGEARESPGGQASTRPSSTAPDSSGAPSTAPDEKDSAEPEPGKETWGKVGEFELTERSGRKVTDEDLRGRPWAVCFVFTNCAGPCPRVTGQMKILQDRLGDVPVRLVTITVDPKRDTPEKLRKYAKAFGADEKKWLFLTGKREEIYSLIRDSFKMPVKEPKGESRTGNYQILHTTHVMHVDAEGRIRGKYNALVESEMDALRQALEKEAAAVDETSEAEGTSAGDGER